MKRIMLYGSMVWLLFAGSLLAGEFYGYYTHVDSKEAFDKASRTSAHSDIVVKIGDGRLVFWRGKSYLPYWETPKGKWSLEEVVPRKGDGTDEMPDRVNAFSHVDLVKNEAGEIVVEWRYLPEFKGGNPTKEMDWRKFVEETYSISPSGKVVRAIRKGTETFDDWKDPLHQTVIHLQLNNDGVKTLKRVEPSKTKAPQVALKGNPVKNLPAIKPDLHWSFDEGVGDQVKESISGKKMDVAGQRTFWKKGISGAAIAFDGYSNGIEAKADLIPSKLKGLTCSIWFTIGAYPWDTAPLITKGEEKGFLLGLTMKGQPTLSVNVDGRMETMTLNKTLKTRRWYHLAGVIDGPTGKLKLFLNGEPVEEKTVQGGELLTSDSPIKIGKGTPRPIDRNWKNIPLIDYSHDGLIDEVGVYKKALNAEEIKALYSHYKPVQAQMEAPDMPTRALPTFTKTEKFGARYTHLNLYETWDAMWRLGPNADVVVDFENSSSKFVFWHGANYIPHMVNELGQWYSNEFNETRRRPEGEGCLEPMSDKHCYNNHARIIENTPARVVIHWRYPLRDVGGIVADFNYDTGWGDWSDWYFYIYPDGVAAKFMHIYTTGKYRHEFQETMILTNPGQRPEDLLEKDPILLLADLEGKTTSIPYTPENHRKRYPDNVIQVLNLKGKQDPFSIGHFKTTAPTVQGNRNNASAFTYWNHWPVALIPSDGRWCFFPDRVSSSTLSHLDFGHYQFTFNYEPFMFRTAYGYKRSCSKVMLEGFSERKAEDLLGLAKSWLQAPDLTTPKGCYSKEYILHNRAYRPGNRVPEFASKGYIKHERAYHLAATAPELSFTIAASPVQPIENLAFKIFNWSHGETGKVTLNGKPLGASCKQGIVRDERGRQALVVWITHTSTKPAQITISGAKPEKTSEFTAQSAKGTIEQGIDTFSVKIEADLAEQITTRRFMFECSKGMEWNSGWQVENGIHLRDVTDLEPDTEYAFRIKVMDLYGNESPWYDLPYKTPALPKPGILTFKNGFSFEGPKDADAITVEQKGTVKTAVENGTPVFMFENGGHLVVNDGGKLKSSGEFTWMAWVKTTSDGTFISTYGDEPDRERNAVSFVKGKPLFAKHVKEWRYPLTLSAKKHPKINDGKWHHVAVRASAGTMNVLSIDGEPVNSERTGERKLGPGLPLRIGSLPSGASKAPTFSGQLKDLRIYPCSLTDAAIRSIYKETKAK